MKPSKVQSNASIIKEQGEALRRNHILIEQLRKENEVLKSTDQGIAKDRSSGKPSWSDAPEDATHLIQNPRGQWAFVVDFERFDDGTVRFYTAKKIYPSCAKSEVLSDWRETLEQRPAIISRDSDEALGKDLKVYRGQEQWRGPEDGLPPVGIECEYTKPDGYRGRDCVWFWCKVIAHDEGGAVVRTEKGHYHLRKIPEYAFRHLCAEEDKAVDVVVEASGKTGDLARCICTNLYRAIISDGIEIK